MNETAKNAYARNNKNHQILSAYTKTQQDTHYIGNSNLHPDV